MRTLLVATVTVVVAALTGGCGGDGGSDGPGGQGPGVIDDSAPVDPESPATPSTQPGDGAFDSAACDEVRAGIDAYNDGDLDETVERFQAALPLAEEQDDGSALAGQLVEAVRYYAELDPDHYPSAARSSPEFAKYKAITLGQCVAGDAEPPGADV